jgi:curved DNA-binding protein CbpA
MPHQITLYDTLGVEPDASDEDIRSAFRKLTREQHPDRFAGSERQRAEERFQTITEAFNVLSRPESREKYDLEMSIRKPRAGAPSKAMDPKELARRLAAKGADSIRGGRLPEALDDLKLAIDHDDENSRAHYYYGYALSRINGREKEGLRHLERAVVLEPNNPTFKAEAAVICLAVGLTARAGRLASDALGLDPTNEKAKAVVAKIDEAEEPKSQGLLGRLRRKG